MAERFDAIVVGSGTAGAIASVALRKAGRSVLLVDPPGEGEARLRPAGVAWRADPSAALKGIPGVPLERRIIERRLAFLSSEGALSIDFRDLSWASAARGGWVVEPARWEAWAMGRPVERGWTTWKGTPLEAVIADRAGRVTGIRAGGREASATVVLLDDESALPIAKKAGLALRVPPKPEASASPGTLGESVVETSIDLPLSRVDDRFGGAPGRGFTVESVLGFLPPGGMGFGFVYPGRSSVHAGVVLQNRSFAGTGTSPSALLEKFLDHPATKPYVRGGVRQGTCISTLLPSGAPRSLFGEGFLLLGAAARATAAGGIAVRGADASVATGIAAAETASEAIAAKDPGGRVLSRYVTRLRREGILHQMGRPDERAARLKWNPRLHRAYPELFSSLFRRMMTERSEPKQHMKDLVQASLKGSGVPYTALARDLLAVVGSL